MALTAISSAGAIMAQASPTDPTSDEIAEELDCLTLGNSQNPQWVWEQSHSGFRSEVQGWSVPSMVGGSLLLLQPRTIESGVLGQTSVKVSNVAAGVFQFDAYAGTEIPLKLFVDDVFVQEISTNTPNVQVPLDNSKLHAIKWTAETSDQITMSAAGLDNVRFTPASSTVTTLDIPATITTSQLLTIHGSVTTSAGDAVTEGASDAVLIYRQVPGETSLTYWLPAIFRSSDGTFSTSPESLSAGIYKFQVKYTGGAKFLPSESEVKTVTVTDQQDHKQDAIDTATTLINDPTITANTFLSKNNHKPFDNKLQEVINYINAGDYTTALSKLQNDLIAKTDGVQLAGTPHKHDWVKANEQKAIYEQLLLIKADLEKLQGTSTVITGDVYVTYGSYVKDKVGTATFNTANGAWTLKTTTSLSSPEYGFAVSDAAPVNGLFSTAALISPVTPVSGMIDQSGTLGERSAPLATINQFIANGGVFLLSPPQG